jgi:hypothetical protein
VKNRGILLALVCKSSVLNGVGEGNRTLVSAQSNQQARVGFQLGRVNTNSQSFDYKSKDDESGKKGVELVEATEDPTIALESSKESFNFVSPTISHSIGPMTFCLASRNPKKP